MHVLIIPSWYFPAESDEIGGRMFHQLAAGLREQEIDARIFFGDFSLRGPIKKQTHFKTEESVPTWRVSQWLPPKLNSFFIHQWVRKYVQTIFDYIDKQGRPDIIHAQSYMAGIVCAEVKRSMNIPFVLTERVSTFISNKIPPRHFSFIANAFNAASGLTAVSPGLKNYMQRLTKNKIEIIPNFYDPSIFYPDFSKPKFEKFTWLSVGEPAYVKGLDILLKAYAIFKKKYQDNPMQLMLIDRIRGKKEIKSLSHQLNIENEIIWKGLISPVEVSACMRQSHALISASRTETFGKTIMEAQACGLPVIATKTEGAAYILQSMEQGLLIAVNDVDALVEAMEKMYLNINNYTPDKLGLSVESRFRKEVVIRQWINYYHNLIM